MIVPLLLQIHAGAMPVNPSAGPRIENTYTFASKATPRIEITTQNGRIIVSRADGNSVVVKVNRRARTPDAAAALVQNVTQEGNVVSATGASPDSCTQNCGSVDFTVSVPKGATIVARTNNGEIDINDVDGSVDAQSQNGDVLAGGLAGDANLRTSNGRVNAGFRDLSRVKTISVMSSNGTVRVVIPRGAKLGHVDAHTDNGKVYSQLSLGADESNNHADVHRQLNGTGPSLTMKTSNGDLDITVVEP